MSGVEAAYIADALKRQYELQQLKYGYETVNQNEVFTGIEQKDIMRIKTVAQSLYSNLVNVQSTDVVMAGGAFTSWYHYEEPKDIDFFVLYEGNGDNYRTMKAWLDAGVDTGKIVDVTQTYRRDNPHVLHVYNDVARKHQYILTDYKTRAELIASFDYLHCTVSFYRGQLLLTRKAFDAMSKKHLIRHNKERKEQEWRRKKFLDRGFADPASPAQPMTKDQFDAMIRQTVSSTGWQTAARINPSRGFVMGAGGGGGASIGANGPVGAGGAGGGGLVYIPTQYVDYDAKYTPYTDAIKKQHLDKLLEDLEKNGL